MNVTLITAFHGRHNEIERIVRCFIEQDYIDGDINLLLYNNSPIEQTLDREIYSLLKPNQYIKLINNHIDQETKIEYENTGAIFRDALRNVPLSTNIVNHFDSDDIYFPNHVSEGVKGFKKALEENKLAYKPYYSYFLYQNTKQLAHNNLEPSVFIDFNFLKEHGYLPLTARYNQGWYDPLIEKKLILDDVDGKPTFIYNWSSLHNNHKISGAGDSIANFRNHRRWEINNGDRIISAGKKEELEYYFKLVESGI